MVSLFPGLIYVFLNEHGISYYLVINEPLKTPKALKKCILEKKLKILHKDKIDVFLRILSLDYNIFVPAKKGGNVTLIEYRENSYLRIPFSNTLIPPARGFLFPPSSNKYFDLPYEDSWQKPGPKALFGIRPCDAHSITLLDSAVKDNDFYNARRKEILIITEGCNRPSSTCFCTSVDGSPFSRNGADIFMHDIGEVLLVEDVSGRGAKYVNSLPDAGHAESIMTEKTREKALKMIEESINIAGIPEKLESIDKQIGSGMFWEEVGGECSNCARCTAVCPTCHCCFVVEDVAEMVYDELGEAAGKLDPCLLNISLSEGMTSQLPSGYKRLQRRLMDKFCRTMKTVGRPFCVGCGRCIQYCSENVDMMKILKTVLEENTSVS